MPFSKNLRKINRILVFCGRNFGLAYLTPWPPAQLDALRRVLRGDPLRAPDNALEIVRSLPHGHVAAVLGTVRRLGVDHLIAAKKSWHRALGLAMIVARLLTPAIEVGDNSVRLNFCMVAELSDATVRDG